MKVNRSTMGYERVFTSSAFDLVEKRMLQRNTLLVDYTEQPQFMQYEGVSYRYVYAISGLFHHVVASNRDFIVQAGALSLTGRRANLVFGSPARVSMCN